MLPKCTLLVRGSQSFYRDGGGHNTRSPGQRLDHLSVLLLVLGARVVSISPSLCAVGQIVIVVCSRSKHSRSETPKPQRAAFFQQFSTGQISHESFFLGSWVFEGRRPLRVADRRCERKGRIGGKEPFLPCVVASN